jgi:hypothetical protein
MITAGYGIAIWEVVGERVQSFLAVEKDEVAGRRKLWRVSQFHHLKSAWKKKRGQGGVYVSVGDDVCA